MKDYDLAYASESMARAYSISGNKDKSSKWYKKVKTAGDLIESDCDKESFIFDLNLNRKNFPFVLLNGIVNNY